MSTPKHFNSFRVHVFLTIGFIKNLKDFGKYNRENNQKSAKKT